MSSGCWTHPWRIFFALFLAGGIGSLAAAQLPSPALLVLNKEDNSLAIVDPASGKSLARIPVGEGPHEVVASDDKKLAFTSNYGSPRAPGNTISVIDLHAQKELRRLELGALRRPHGLAFADGKLYFTAEGSKAIARYDPGTNQIDWMMGTGLIGTHMVMLSKDRRQIYVANIGSDAIVVMDAPAWNLTVIPVGKGPEGFDVSPDGKQLWAAHSRDGGVSVIDLGSRKVADRLDVRTKRSNRLKFTPDGKRVLISDMEGGELLVLDAATRKEIKRISTGRSPEGILIVPDGSRAFVAVTGDNRLAVVDLRTLEITGHVPAPGGPDGMAWVE